MREMASFRDWWKTLKPDEESTGGQAARSSVPTVDWPLLDDSWRHIDVCAPEPHYIALR